MYQVVSTSMTYEQFVIWLHGFFEISNAKTLTQEQVKIIKDHLNMFFDKQTSDKSLETEKSITNSPNLVDPNNLWRGPYISQQPNIPNDSPYWYEIPKIIC